MKRAPAFSRSTLLFSVTVAVLGLLIIGVGALAYMQLYEQRRLLVQESNTRLSAQVSSAMTMWLDGQVRLANMMAGDARITGYLANPHDAAARQEAEEYLQRIHEQYPNFTLINVMYYLKPGEQPFTVNVGGSRRHIGNGYSLVDSISGRSVGVGGFTFNYIRAVAEGSRAFISEAKPNALPGLPPIYMVAVPVYGPDGEVLAALGFGVKLEYFNNIFITHFSLGETGRLEILDSQGLFICSSDAVKVLNKAALPEGEAVLASVLAEVAPGAFSMELHGEEYDYAAVKVDTPFDMANSWWVLFRRSAAEAHDELSGSRNLLIMVCCAVSLFMFAMALRARRAASKVLVERERRKENELKRVFVDAAPHAIILADKDWRMTEVNPAASRIFGYQEHELLGRSLQDLLEVHAGNLFNPGEPVSQSGEGVGRGKNGKKLLFVFDVGSVNGGRHLVFLRDETELEVHKKRTSELSEDLARALRESERLRLEAERANNAKSEFLANMSHEIRTPMNAIIGMAHLVLRRNLEPQLRQYVETIQGAGKSLLGVINSVLDFSKIEAGKMHIEHVPFELGRVLRQIRAMFQQPVETKGLELRVRQGDDVPLFVRGDPLRLEQVLTNLISNAVKFTSTGSISVDVSLVELEGPSALVRFAVTDTGIGMTQEESARLFQAFSQADTSTTRKYGGTGLGLVISKLLVELMQGTFTLTSAAGEGSCFAFTVRLECASAVDVDDTIEAHSARTDPDAYACLNGRSVLLVEDNAINQEVALELLGSVGLKVDVAENGAEAVDKLAHAGHGYDLVLMDVQMPVMDGYEATRRSREYPHNKDLPVIAMTAHAMSSERDRCLQAGMNDHISKPIEVAVLYATLAHWLDPGINPS